MALKDTVSRHRNLLEQVGKYGLSVQFPDDFEVYIVALELINSSGETLKYFIFPIMPSTIDENINFTTSIKKTFGGISVLSSTTFTPNDITLSGNFGRRLQVLLGKEYIPIIDGFKKIVSQGISKIEFDTKVKTGYGCCKVLQSICEESKTLEDGNPKTLILHNLALGNSYIVKPQSLRFTQSQDTNMIWNYSLPLKAVAPLSLAFSSKEVKIERLRLGGTDWVQQDLSRVTSKLSKFLL